MENTDEAAADASRIIGWVSKSLFAIGQYPREKDRGGKSDPAALAHYL
jgi:hypothetical protein